MWRTKRPVAHFAALRSVAHFRAGEVSGGALSRVQKWRWRTLTESLMTHFAKWWRTSLARTGDQGGARSDARVRSSLIRSPSGRGGDVWIGALAPEESRCAQKGRQKCFGANKTRVRNEPGYDWSITQAKGARCVTPGTLVAMARRAYGKNRDASAARAAE